MTDDGGIGGSGGVLAVVPADVIAVGSALKETAELLFGDLQQTGRKVDALTTSGWTGDAASAYAHGWDDCQDAGMRIFAALAELAEKLHLTGAEFDSADQRFCHRYPGTNP